MATVLSFEIQLNEKCDGFSFIDLTGEEPTIPTGYINGLAPTYTGKVTFYNQDQEIAGQYNINPIEDQTTAETHLFGEYPSHTISTGTYDVVYEVFGVGGDPVATAKRIAFFMGCSILCEIASLSTKFFTGCDACREKNLARAMELQHYYDLALARANGGDSIGSDAIAQMAARLIGKECNC